MTFEHLRLMTQISIGFMLFWITAGWSLLGESLSPENQELPPSKPTSSPEVWRTRDNTGRGLHALGQGFAMLGLCTLASLCARVLKPYLYHRSFSLTWIAIPWANFALAALNLLLVAESVAVLMGMGLPSQRVSLDRFSFASGRDQVVRHGTALFLGLGLFIVDFGLASSGRLALGVCLGWGASILLWDRRTPLSIQVGMRHPIAVAGFAMAIILMFRLVRMST